MLRKRINDISEIYASENLLITDFSNLDLSNIDLSVISIEKWENCIFYNTSFKNTGIRFIPNKLMRKGNKIDISYCDFSDNDFSFLERKDFCYEGTDVEITTTGCNFFNTNINFLRKLIDVTLDISYQEFDFDFWGYRDSFFGNEIDIYTILKNPFLKISSARLLWSICIYCFSVNLKHDLSEIMVDSEYQKKMVEDCELFLELDRQGYARSFYNMLCKDFTIEQKWYFFLLQIRGIYLKNLDFSDIPIEIIGLYEWQNNKFDNVVINSSLSELLKMNQYAIVDFYGFQNEYSGFYLPSITYESWKDNCFAQKRISQSSITFFTKVYLELSRVCNANCIFCRNKSFDRCKYDLQSIRRTLYMIKDYINAVVVGGGEPTLRLDDVKYLRDSFLGDSFDWHMFSNGTNPFIIDDKFIMDSFKINLSRHAVSDEENASIFRVSSSDIMTSKDIERLNSRNGNVTLNATCFNGGLDSLQKIIDYINYAKKLGCKKVLIQDLQKSASLKNSNCDYSSLFISSIIFDEVIDYLKSIGFKQKYPIYATGGYVSYVFEDKDNFSVSIQRYITYEELQENWIKAIKRAFDLSIDPCGNLYENWHQNSGIVKRLK